MFNPRFLARLRSTHVLGVAAPLMIKWPDRKHVFCTPPPEQGKKQSRQTKITDFLTYGPWTCSQHRFVEERRLALEDRVRKKEEKDNLPSTLHIEWKVPYENTHAPTRRPTFQECWRKTLRTFIEHVVMGGNHQAACSTATEAPEGLEARMRSYGRGCCPHNSGAATIAREATPMENH